MSTSQSIHSSHADQAQQWRRSSPVQSTTHKRQPMQIPQPQEIPQVPGPPRTRKFIENCYPGVNLPSHLSQNAKSPLANYVSMKWGFQPSYQTVKCVIQGKSQFRSFVLADELNDHRVQGCGDNVVAKAAEQLAALDALYQLQALGCLDNPPRNFVSDSAPSTKHKHFLSDGVTGIDFETARNFIQFYCEKFGVTHKADVHQVFSSSSKSKKRHSDGWSCGIIMQRLDMGRANHSNKKQATQLAYIEATRYIDSCDDTIFKEYQASIRDEVESKAKKAAIEAHRGVTMSYHASDKVQEILDGVIDNIKSSKMYSKRPYNEEEEDVITRPSTPTSAVSANGGAAAAAKKQFKPRRPPAKRHLENKSRSMSKDLEFYNTNEQFEKIRAQRASLPIFTQAEEVVSRVNDNMITVLMAATGSGKTTQMPQLILDDAIQHGRGAKCNILCTQPRRIAAISVAQRVAAERGEKLGKRVGYQVRFESKRAEPHGSINFCTTGVFLRRMQSALEESEASASTDEDGERYGLLDDITHVVVDEVHERDVDTDLTLVVLKRLIADRQARGKPLKVILMSATIDSDLFQNYFASVNNGVPAPVADIPGRSFPVTKYFLDDYLEELKGVPENEGGWVFREKNVSEYMRNEFRDNVGGDEIEIPYPLVALTIAHVLSLSRNADGHLLIFLPGWDEIKAVQTILEEQKLCGINFNDTSKYSIHVLHSSVPVQEQQKIFEPCQEGIRRIILSTNVAETSVTIPDVVYVVDAARVKEKRYDAERHMSQLVSAWVGKSNLNQRAGRAGRHREGEYYGVLSKRRYESLAAHQTVEMKRVDLSEVVLRVKALNFPGLEVEDVLAQAIEPPAPERVQLALERLLLIGAINKKKELTSLGKVLLQLPIEAPIGKLILYATFFRCLDPALTLAAILTNRDPFVAPLDLRAEANAAKQRWCRPEYKGDPFTILNAYEAWWALHSAGKHSQAWDFVNDNFLSRATLLQIRQVKEHLYKSLESLKLTEFLTADPVLNKAKVTAEKARARKGELLIPEYLNTNAHSKPMLAALIAMSCSPNFALRTGDRNHRTAAEKSVFIHSSSVLHPRNEKDDVKYQKQMDHLEKHVVSFQEKTKNISNLSAGPPGKEPQVMLRMCTRLDLMVYAMFGAAEIKRDRGTGEYMVDDWVTLLGAQTHLESLQKLKQMMHACMLRAFEGVHAGSALEQSEMYNDEEVYKLDNMLVLQSEEEAEQVDEEKLSPKEQVELDVMANNVVFLLNQFAKEKDENEARVLHKLGGGKSKSSGGNNSSNSKGGSHGSQNSHAKHILKRPAPSSQGTSRQPSSSSGASGGRFGASLYAAMKSAQSNNKISERIQALQQSSQYATPRERNKQAIDTRLSVKGRAARFSQFDTGKPLEPVRYGSSSDNRQRQIIGNRIPRASTGASDAPAGAAGAQRSVSAGGGAATESEKKQRRRSEDISMLTTQRLSIMSDESSQSVPTPNMLRANSAILAELMGRGDAEDGVAGEELKEDAKLKSPVDSNSGTCTVMSQSRSPTPKLPEEDGEELAETSSSPKQSAAVPSLVVVPPKDNSAEANVRREKEKRMQLDQNSADNGWKYIATNKAKHGDSEEVLSNGSNVDTDFGPSMSLDDRFNFISLTEPSAISKLEPKLDEAGNIATGGAPQHTTTPVDRAGSHKSRLSTSDSIANSHADSTKSTFKTSMGRIFKGRMFKRRKTLEGVNSPSNTHVPPLPTSFSQTLPALRSIEPMKINLPTAEEIERREEEKRSKEEEQLRRKKEREEEMLRNRAIQEERVRKLKDASRSRSDEKVGSKVQDKAANTTSAQSTAKENTPPQQKQTQEEPEFAIEDADWATAVIREFN
ncbi:hypothetical protein E3P99_03496 [Wallemia hederae]|uniref:P-loop containing nucleoside triphosphate hydrolase protein n=1 Tax=Wallemia hederae TaxID=1540922 RepID=A0A4V4LSL4_9BASI|nr:hypothetical protein E3P99_03496 [Wallemia hederae]